MLGSIIGNAIGALGSIYGGIKASKAMKGVKEDIDNQRKDNQSWYDRRYNEDATQRADAQRILQITNENIRNRNRAAAGRAAVDGAAMERVAAEKAANNAALADAASQIAVAGASRKDDIEQSYRQQDQALRDKSNQMEVNRANAITQAAGGLASAAGEAGMAYDQNKLDQQRIAGEQKIYESLFDQAKDAK